MPDLDIGPIEARAAAATKGPWEAVRGAAADALSWVEVSYDKSICLDADWSDAEFIAHALEDVPALLEEVKRLRGVIDMISDKHEDVFKAGVASARVGESERGHDVHETSCPTCDYVDRRRADKAEAENARLRRVAEAAEEALRLMDEYKTVWDALQDAPGDVSRQAERERLRKEQPRSLAALRTALREWREAGK